MKSPAIAPSVAARFEAPLAQALGQVRRLRDEFPEVFPHGWTQSNRYLTRDLDGFAPGSNVGWTTGFWTGLLWLAFELDGDVECRMSAARHVGSFAQRIRDRIQVDHHDMGFLYTPSCVAAWRLTADGAAQDAALAAADLLMQRYLPQAGIIQAWGDLQDLAQRGRIIIDCLLNLPLLSWACEVSGDSAYRNVARSHLLKSRDHLVRPDASSFHTFHFDVETGEPLRGSTAQGAADDSCWARGQAWGIYGFALNHRFAPDLGLLAVSRRQADYFLARLPKNGIAYWDLAYVEGSGEPWDSSASAIAVCGLLELASHLPAGEGAHYRHEALRILEGLVLHCQGAGTTSNALLLHGVYSKPCGKGVDEASLWGDYFYLEALARVARGWHGHW
ncbi:glycoside hydrolase family 88 protein [Roseateles violae]|uniref:Glycoside hydrolase family 88 protein n=1 Tax=Roseateles violae TaxID=3058042 RepID=A0ABT8DMN1_9BURK|nr:glycoside hydrolase family 88 protein [Pelomonas sp. PFR6]MDN3919372.1 glycoside hydrolase family 88 protein [Pelomonas sp. PFR6]